MRNSLWLYARPDGHGVMLKIGHSGSGRAVSLSDDEAVKLGHRLMALGSGGETRGFEKYPRDPSPLNPPAFSAPYGSKPDGSPKELKDLT